MRARNLIVRSIKWNRDNSGENGRATALPPAVLLVKFTGDDPIDAVSDHYGFLIDHCEVRNVMPAKGSYTVVEGVEAIVYAGHLPVGRKVGGVRRAPSAMYDGQWDMP